MDNQQTTLQLNDTLKILLDLSTRLASIDSKVGCVVELFKNHEDRIQKLEEKGEEKARKWAGDWKEDLIKMLVRCILIGSTVIGTLVGVKNFSSGTQDGQVKQIERHIME